MLRGAELYLDVRSSEGAGQEECRATDKLPAKKERKRRKRRKRERAHNRKSRNGFVYPAGGETVSHFLCFGGSGLIFPSVTSVSLAAVAKCDTKLF